ncbi:hypothetical protein [Paraburkholderia lycopersici]|uniref:hypothetical protein n=1 Tax=Paraburkholderia lycopersici TaxID=416944 RepID=UPI0011614BFA|nr:hypothetical protein [Paraburkholderia lycopersici]
MEPATGGRCGVRAAMDRSVSRSDSVMVESHSSGGFKSLNGYFFRTQIVKYHQIGKKVHRCKETNMGNLQPELKAPPSHFLRLALSCEN